mmetsp:Transcript_37023/g.73967  ORF Transcript_37023/g.73967 Transcript_37023/m.73967 type:complete len:239 (-) Transcript_37023:53-769(-)
MPLPQMTLPAFASSITFASSAAFASLIFRSSSASIFSAAANGLKATCASAGSATSLLLVSHTLWNAPMRGPALEGMTPAALYASPAALGGIVAAGRLSLATLARACRSSIWMQSANERPAAMMRALSSLCERVLISSAVGDGKASSLRGGWRCAIVLSDDGRCAPCPFGSCSLSRCTSVSWTAEESTDASLSSKALLACRSKRSPSRSRRPPARNSSAPPASSSLTIRRSICARVIAR